MEPPEKPDEADCCNSGCNPCILDVYEQQLRKYNESLLPDKTTYVNCMKPTSYAAFRLVKCTPHTPTTDLLTFEYVVPPELVAERCDDVSTHPPRTLKVCYEPGQHFLVKCTSGSGCDVFTRAYTPIPAVGDTDRQFTVLVRHYEQGKMSRYLKRLKIGDVTRWRGPYGDYAISYERRRILGIVQGTGIAPVYTVADRLIRNDECYTFVHVFCCCRSLGEVLLRDELRELAAHWNFTYEIFLGDCRDGERGFGEKINLGRLAGGDVEAFVRDKGTEGLQVLICGSDSFARIVEGYVIDCNVEDVFVF